MILGVLAGDVDEKYWYKKVAIAPSCVLETACSINASLLDTLLGILLTRTRSTQLPPFFGVTGAYVHGPFTGSHLATRQFELVSILLAAIVRSLNPELQFSLVALSRYVRSGIHKDVSNSSMTTSLVAPASHFPGGEIWL